MDVFAALGYFDWFPLFGVIVYGGVCFVCWVCVVWFLDGRCVGFGLVCVTFW